MSAYSVSVPRLEQSIAVPSYWISSPAEMDRMLAAAPTVGLCVVNCGDGPGVERRKDWALTIDKLRASGVRVLCYVFNDFARRPVEECVQDISQWRNWYGVFDGVFHDTFPPLVDRPDRFDKVNAGYAERLTAASRWIMGGGTQVANPGTGCEEAVLRFFDVVMDVEGPLSWYRRRQLTVTDTASTHQPEWTMHYPAERFWHCVNTVTTVEQMDEVAARSQTRNAGWVYATPFNENSTPSTYKALPPEDLWRALVAAVERRPR